MAMLEAVAVLECLWDRVTWVESLDALLCPCLPHKLAHCSIPFLRKGARGGQENECT